MSQITDTQRLEWMIRNHYRARELYMWFGDNVPVIRQQIDEDIRAREPKATATTLKVLQSQTTVPDHFKPAVSPLTPSKSS